MEEDKRTSSLYYQILCLSPECEQWWTASRKKHGSWEGARKNNGSRCSLRIWCLAPLFNRYRANVPRFPGLAELLIPYLFSSELWLARPWFLPAQPIPHVFHPRPPSTQPLQATGRLTPPPDSYHFSHHVCPGPMLLLPGIFHQFSFQWHPWLAQSCSSHDWTFALLHVPVWDCCRDSPLHSAWMKIK